MPTGFVSLVGAGPGDPGLITVKALACLREADVVIYDRLASPELLREARPDAELIPCGKEPKRHPMPQEEINRVLVAKASEGLRVCRLKGGDPIVFGRGAEEALALREAGIAFEIVPGVSSSVAAGAYAGVPVTLRGVASSFAVVTGHEDPTKPHSAVDWRALAGAVDTIVILMGIERAAEIAAELIAGGRPGETPVACVERATTPRHRTVLSSLATLGEDIAREGIANPTVLIVGEAARLHEQLAWFETRPLFGKRVLVTRTREQASELSRLLEREGAQPVETPVIRIAEPESREPFEEALGTLAGADWLVFTSTNGVRRTLARLAETGRDIRVLHGPRIAAIGPKTAEELGRLGLRVEAVPEDSVGEGLAARLAEEGLAGKRVVLLRAEEAREAFVTAAREAGADVAVVPVYRTLPIERLDPDALALLEAGEIDAVAFASSSAVRNTVGAIGPERAAELLSRCRIACIGPITAAAAHACGLPVHIEAGEHTVEALVRALASHFAE